MKGFRKEALFVSGSVPIPCQHCVCEPCVQRVLTVPQAFKDIDWNTGVLAGVMIPPATAMLTTVATPVNLMVVGHDGYKFGDYWKYGLPIGIRWLVVNTFLVPLFRRFQSRVRI
jgi:di/tricarboxylate transporter